MSEELQEVGVNVGNRCVGRLMRDNAIKIIKDPKCEPPRAKAHGITLVQAALVQNLLHLGS